jgi:protein TonB
MAAQNTYSQTTSDRISFTLFLAVAVHAIVILGISFSNTPSTNSASTLEITLSTHSSESSPQEADYIAQHNQQGSGTLDEKAELTTRQTALYNDLEIKNTGQTAQRRSDTRAQQIDSQYLTTLGKSSYTVNVDPLQQQLDQQQLQKLQSDEQINHDIASLNARIDSNRQAYAKRPRIHRITSVATRSSIDAQYQYKFQQKVEQIGNENYPQAAKLSNIEGDVLLVVTLKPNGTIHNIEVAKSSGQALLDAAAIRSVRMSAPFEPFSAQMRQKADLLEIIRTWQFSQAHLTSRG